MCFGVGCVLLPSFFLFQNSSLYQDFVEVVDCNEMEVSADPPCCEFWEPKCRRELRVWSVKMVPAVPTGWGRMFTSYPRV